MSVKIEQQYKCPLCPKICSSHAGVYDHAKVHTQERPFACEYCDFRASRKCNIKAHTRACHLPPEEFQAYKKFKCQVCGYRALSNAALKRHGSKHTGEKPLSCPVSLCDFRTSSAGSLKVHMRLHTDERPYPCTFPGCKYEARWSSRLYAHMAVHSEERPLECPHAGCSFRGKLRCHLKQHLKNHGTPMYPCTFPGCNYKAKHRLHLRNHEGALHSEKQTFACSFPGCTHRVKLAYQLSAHMKVHSDERPYKCSHCDLSFKRNQSRKEHERSHTEEPFRCSYPDCEFYNWRKGNMKKHEESHKQRSFSCTIPACTFRAKSTAKLDTHLKNHHRPDSVLCFVSGCGFRTHLPKLLRRHVELHHVKSPRKHVCPLCPRSYECESHLEDHLRSHTGERPYECPMCPFRSVGPQGIVGHMKRMHSVQITKRDFTGHRVKKSKVPRRPPSPVVVKTEDKPFRPPVVKGETILVCTVCSQTFGEEDKYEAHLHGHMKNEPFECPHCQFNCEKMREIIEHVRIRHRKVFSWGIPTES